ncbi:site-2 protease family protein [Actinokineospora sp. NBRC 105648]|uniref:site-2 protease family protein n=1 Tax=Actinokineospora sp. NBRC 105648 TaxID=3032206 RepID=UPI0024A0434F|nr:site-2 protease family protein [Actinokineospora sp. NBRC 105648]GLZ37318.1 peptidase M50 [Actinokineospora sp. NBRC 105648]
MSSTTHPATPAHGGGLLLFRYSGVPVVLAPSWWLGALAVVVFYAPLVGTLLPGAGPVASVLLAAAFAVLLGGSVLAHELGHCVVALRLGLPVRRLRLFLLGGLSEIARTPRRPGHEGVIAAAGPAVSILLAGACGIGLLVMPAEGPVWLLVLECAFANTAVAVFNLLPGLPLDGGRMLRAGVWAVTGRRGAGTRAAVVGGWVVAALLVVWALWGVTQESPDRWLRLGVCLFTAWFVVAGAGGELAAEQRRSWPEGLRLADIVRPVLQLPAESPVADALAAAAGRGVVLVRADGVAAGLLDEVAARGLAERSPFSPAELAAEPIRPETVLLAAEPGEEIAERVHETAAWQFLVVDDEGRPAGVLHREDLRAALRARGLD